MTTLLLSLLSFCMATLLSWNIEHDPLRAICFGMMALLLYVAVWLIRTGLHRNHLTLTYTRYFNGTGFVDRVGTIQLRDVSVLMNGRIIGRAVWYKDYGKVVSGNKAWMGCKIVEG